MATHEEPLPKWLEDELRQQGVRSEVRVPRSEKRDPSEVSKPAYERGTPCPY